MFIPAGHILSYRPDIDGLRAVAVTLVILVHAFPNVLRNGFIGVDIFFVISGFLITNILLTQLNDGSFNLGDFYVRRANRILPALIAVLIASLVFGWVALYSNEFRLLAGSVATSAGFVANIGFYFESGYWDITAKLKPLLHLWSLGVEEQFYVVWPLLLWGVWTWRRAALGLLLLCLIVLSLALNLWLTRVDQPAAFYLPFGRVWELGAGGALAYIQRRGAIPRSTILNDVAAFAGIGLIIVALALRYSPIRFPGAHAIIPVLGAVLIIGAGAEAWPNKHVLSRPAVVYVGLISFPLYLWHWPLLAFGRILNNGELLDSFRNAALALTIALAAATYHCIERPIRAHRNRRRLIAAMSCALSAACGLIGYAIFANDGIRSRSSSSYGLVLTNPPRITTKAKAAMIGDSFAGYLDAPLRAMYGDRLLTFAGPSWPYLQGLDFKPGLRPSNWPGNPQQTEKVLATIVSDTAIEAVVIFHAAQPYVDLDNLRSYPVPVPGETSLTVYEAGVRRTLKLLTDAGKRVVYVKSNPFLYMLLVEVCSSTALPVPRTRPSECVIPVDVVRQRTRTYNEIVDRALEGMPNVSVLDTAQLLICDERFCYVERDGMLMYRDAAHLSPVACQILAFLIAKTIETQISDR